MPEFLVLLRQSEQLYSFSFNFMFIKLLGYESIFLLFIFSQVQVPAAQFQDPKSKPDCYGVFCLTYDLKAVSIPSYSSLFIHECVYVVSACFVSKLWVHDYVINMCFFGYLGAEFCFKDHRWCLSIYAC